MERRLERPAQEEGDDRTDRDRDEQDLHHRIRVPDVREHFGGVREVVVGDDVEACVEFFEEEPLRRREVEQARDGDGGAAVQEHAVDPGAEPAIRHEQDVERQRREQVQALDEVVDEAGRQHVRQPRRPDIGLGAEAVPQEDASGEPEHQVDGHDGQPGRKARKGIAD